MTVRTLSTPPAYAVAVPIDAQALDAWDAWERHLDAGRIVVRNPPPDPGVVARRLRTEAQFVRLRAAHAPHLRRAGL